MHRRLLALHQLGDRSIDEPLARQSVLAGELGRHDPDLEVATPAADLYLGARGILPVDLEDTTFAASAWVKAPTASEDVGSDESDFGVIGIASGEAGGGVKLDLNLWLSMLGTESGYAGRQEAMATVWLPVGQPWSVFVEGAYQHTASDGDGYFFDAGVTYAITPRSVIDAAAGKGSSRGYPDWSVTIGWTILAVPGR